MRTVHFAVLSRAGALRDPRKGPSSAKKQNRAGRNAKLALETEGEPENDTLDGQRPGRVRPRAFGGHERAQATGQEAAADYSTDRLCSSTGMTMLPLTCITVVRPQPSSGSQAPWYQP